MVGVLLGCIQKYRRFGPFFHKNFTKSKFRKMLGSHAEVVFPGCGGIAIQPVLRQAVPEGHGHGY
jgi:hypothetical protein